MRRDAGHEFQCVHQIRPAPLRLEEQHLADDAQDVAAAFAWRDEFFHLVAEENETDLVVVADGGEGKHGGDLGGEFALGLAARAEQAGAAHVHDEHEREFAFLDKLLNERMIHPRGDVPVNRPHVVAGLIFAHLVEVHAWPLKTEWYWPASVSVTMRFVRSSICRIFLRISRGIMRENSNQSVRRWICSLWYAMTSAARL